MSNMIFDPGQPFQLLSDGKMLILIIDDMVIILEQHYLKKLTTYIHQDMIDISCIDLPPDDKIFLPGMKTTEFDLSIIASGKVDYYQGKDVLKDFDLFKYFQVMDLLKVVRKKLTIRQEKLDIL